jgi:type 1 fimbria pilin
MRKMMILGILASLLMVLSGVIYAYAAETITITGEPIDTYCYVLMGAKGGSHRECAIECVKKGIPAGLLENGTNKVYVLLPDKDKSPLPKGVIDRMGRKVTITGKVYTIGGSQFLTVESIK